MTEDRIARARAVLRFLNGDGHIDGYWFGDYPPEGERGNFWWRKHLADISAAIPDDRFQPIETAPANTPVRIKAGEMTFLARLLPGASVDENEQACNQWVAEIEGEHPPCWSGGGCWSSNENEVESLQPTHWMPAALASLPDDVSEERSMDAKPDSTDAIVAWLRNLAGRSITPGIVAFFGDPFKRDGQLLCAKLADAIERGDHLASIRKASA